MKTGFHISVRRLAALAAALGLALGFLPGLHAQNFVKYSLGEGELIRFNPACAEEDGSRVYGAYKYNWSQSALNQESPYDVAAGLTLKFKWGSLSADFSHDGYSFFKRHTLSVNYSYMWKLDNWRHSRFSVGGGIGFGFDHIDFNALDYSSGLMGKGLYCSPDLNFGFEYNDDHIRAGLGGINLIASGQKFAPYSDDHDHPRPRSDGETLVRNPRVIMSYFMYRFDLAGAGVTPIVHLGYSERIEMLFGLRFDWQKRYALSYCFRTMEMTHNVTANITIPCTLIRLSIAYTRFAFYKDQALSAGISIHW